MSVDDGPRAASLDNEADPEEVSLLEMTSEKRVPVSKEKIAVDWRATGLAFVFPAIGGLLFGWDIGVTSGALANLSSAVTSGTEWYDLDAIQTGAVVSASLAGALTASALAAVSLGDKLGSKRELQLAALLYFIGSCAQGAAPSLELLVAGRFAYGLGIGFAMHAAPMYVSETAPSRVRGLLISVKEGFIVGGILLGYLGCFVINGEEGGWRPLLAASAPVAAALALGMSGLPDSPRWLAQKGAGEGEVRFALQKVRGKVAVGEQFENEISLIMTQSAGVKTGGIGDLFQKRNLKPLYVGLSVVLFQQITGQPSVLCVFPNYHIPPNDCPYKTDIYFYNRRYYAEQVFEAAGYDSSQGAGVSVILGLFKLVMTGVAVKYVDTLGRRPLLLGGVSVMTLATFVLGACSSSLASGSGASIDQNTATASVVAVFMYVGAYQVSFGPIAWLLVGEIFPQRVRSAAVGAATLTNFGSNFLVSLYLPTIIEDFGRAGTYYLFSAMCIVALVSIYLTVVETKGKTLEEIEEQMTR
jgi:MFS family permease